MMRGLITHWIPRLGYGFLRPDGASPRDKDVFFHCSTVEGGDASIYKYASVEFELNPHGGARPSATFVRVQIAHRPEKEQAAPTPKPVTMMQTRPTPKPDEAKELPPAVARALGLLDQPEQHRTKRDRLNSADHGVR